MSRFSPSDSDVNGGEAAAIADDEDARAHLPFCSLCDTRHAEDDCADDPPIEEGDLEDRIDAVLDDKREPFAVAQAFIVTASPDALIEMRAQLKARGFGSTPGLDALIEQRKTNR